MNLELLIKLVKLANNNPNENEANLAARKVCKLIEQGNYNFGVAKTAADKIHITSNPASRNSEWVRKEYEKAEEDIHIDIEDLFRSIFNRDGPIYKPHPRQEEFYNASSNRNQDPKWTGPNTRAPRPKQDLECSRCKNIVNTGFVGPSQVYVCYTCQWNEHNVRR